jgi:ATP-binding cassette subfamily F protein 3
LIDQVGLQIFANDRIGLLGKNGKGKTSLIKAIIEQSSLLNGVIEMNPKIKIGYFAQQTIDMLNINDTPYSLISSTDKRLNQQEIFNFLGRFGFDAEASRKNVEKFSGGEKARLILASIILTKPNILFLDEPTNHLDMTMREQLAISLQDFEGAVILVSHDKFLLQSVVEDFYLIEDQRLKLFKGSLDDYQSHLLSQS